MTATGSTPMPDGHAPNRTWVPRLVLALLPFLGLGPGFAVAEAGRDPRPSARGAETVEYALNAYRVDRARFTLPFHLLNGHILIDGAVDGRRGKFMFDTGTEFPFLLNNGYLPLAKDHRLGQGRAASGQEIVLHRQDEPIARVDLGDRVALVDVRDVIHTNWGFLAEAYGVPAFLGSIGHAVNRNYLFVIDYDLQTIGFHEFGQEREVLEQLIGSAGRVIRIPFTPAGVDGKMPEIELRVGDRTITAFFDTGNAGSLELTDETRDDLQRRGHLTLTATDYAYGMRSPRTVASLINVGFGAKALPPLRVLSFSSGTRDRIVLGYHFLKDFISVWDYKRRTIILIERSGRK
jgi:hypothetical protein